MRRIIIATVLLGMFVNAYSQTTIEYNMKMWTTYTKTLWDSTQITTWGFSEGSKYPVLPGPTLYAEEGDTVVISIRNQSQGAPHTIHWHGLDVDQANDGVPSTSFLLEHMQDSTYTFIAPHPGTYLYHCHVASIVHVQMGMYGSFTVKPRGSENEVWEGGPAFDKEYLWLMSEVDKSWHENVPVHYSTDSLYPEFEVPEYNPDYFLINGNSHHQLRSDGETDIYTSNVSDIVLLRLSNVGYHLNEIIFPSGINSQIISSDGRPLPSFENKDTLLIGPGERYSVLLQSPIVLTDSIQVNYLDINNSSLLATQYGHVKFRQGTGIKSNNQMIDVLAYPNPSASGMFNVVGNFEKGVIVDIHGKELTKVQSNQIDLSQYPKGIYFAKFESINYNKTIKLINQ